MSDTSSYRAINLTPDQETFLAESIAFNRAMFGGFSMELEGGADAGTESGESTSENSEVAGQEAASTEAESTSTDEENAPENGEQEPEGDGENEEGDESSLDLDGAKKALSKVRQSEAKTRLRLREAEAKLANAVTLEDFEAAKAEIASAAATEARELLVENVALKHGLPDELAEALRGETREELEASAKKLAKFAPARPSKDPEVSGGLDPNSGTGEPAYDVDAARARARAVRAGRY